MPMCSLSIGPLLLADAVEEPLHGVEPAARPWVVGVAAGLQRLFETTQQVFLLGRQVDRCLDGDLGEQITAAQANAAPVATGADQVFPSAERATS